MKWIKCSDRMPELCEECLIAFNSVPQMGDDGYCFQLATYVDGDFITFELTRRVKDVTHWMKLPLTPPQMDEIDEEMRKFTEGFAYRNKSEKEKL